jgi:hypothetical protein
VRSCVAFGPGGVALDQGPTRCWHRMPSGHARADADHYNRVGGPGHTGGFFTGGM